MIAHRDDASALLHRANVCERNKYVDIVFHSPTLATDNRI